MRRYVLRRTVYRPCSRRLQKNFLDFSNPESLQILTHCKVEQGLAQAPMPEAGKTAKAYQFMRQGYFCLDSQGCLSNALGVQPERFSEG